MRKLLITGCNGQLGRALNEEYKEEYNSKKVDIINTDVDDLDISSIDAVMAFVREAKPDVVINCGALTAVDLCETKPDEAFLANAIGPRNLSVAAEEIGAKIVQLSTDYVFSGDASRPYIETDQPGPKSVYGATKLAGERFVEQFAKRHFIIRTAWLYGEGKNFVETMLRLAQKNDMVRVVSDQVGTPTSAAWLAKMIHALEPTDNYGLFHGTCEGSCSWADFAVEIFRQANQPVHVEYITTEEFGAAAPRPAYSILDNRMLRLTTDFRMADWQHALTEYMKRRTV